MGNPFGPELFSLGRSKTADLISSIVNAHSNQAADCSQIAFPFNLSNHAVVKGLWVECFERGVSSFSICTISSTTDPPMFGEEMKFLSFPPLVTLWKKLVLLAPCLSQWSLDFFFPTDFFLKDDIYPSLIMFRSSNSTSNRPEFDSFWSRQSISLVRVAFCWTKLPETSFFQIFRFCWMILKLLLNYVAAQLWI